MSDLPKNKEIIDYVEVIACPVDSCDGEYKVTFDDFYEMHCVQSQDHGDYGEFWLHCECNHGHKFRAVLDLSMVISTKLKRTMLIEDDNHE